MQHIMQVAFNFDDTTVQRYVEGQCSNDVLDACVNKAWSKFTDTVPRCTYDNDIDTRDFIVAALCSRLMEQHGSEIVDLAALTLAKRTYQKKAWNEALAEAKCEMEEQER